MLGKTWQNRWLVNKIHRCFPGFFSRPCIAVYRTPRKHVRHYPASLSSRQDSGSEYKGYFVFSQGVSRIPDSPPSLGLNMVFYQDKRTAFELHFISKQIIF